MGVELFHTDGQTYMAKPIVAFRILRTRLKIYNMMSANIGVWNL